MFGALRRRACRMSLPSRLGCRYAHVGAADGDVQLLYVLPLPQGQRRVLIGFRGEERVHAADRGGIFHQAHGWIKRNRGPWAQIRRQTHTPQPPTHTCKTDERHRRPNCHRLEPLLSLTCTYVAGEALHRTYIISHRTVR